MSWKTIICKILGDFISPYIFKGGNKMKNKKIVGDVNKLSKAQLKKYAQNNAKFINQNLTRIENADMTYSKAYRYTQSKLSNKPYMKMTKDGTYRFKSTKAEIEKLSLNQLRSLVKKISDYKQTESGTVTGQKKLEKQAFKNLKKSDKLSEKTKTVISKMSFNDFENLVKSKSFSDMKDRFSSDTVFRFVGKAGFENAMDIFASENIETEYDMYKLAGIVDDYTS